MNKKTNPFLEILSDYWDNFKEIYPAYATNYYNKIINKVLSCSDKSKGFIKYQCTYCGEDEKTIAFTCKHSFCLRCGGMRGLKFVEEVKAKMYSGVSYRHLTLTMPECLWAIFYKNRHSSDWPGILSMKFLKGWLKRSN